jgi:hypothetical protein
LDIVRINLPEDQDPKDKPHDDEGRLPIPPNWMAAFCANPFVLKPLDPWTGSEQVQKDGEHAPTQNAYAKGAPAQEESPAPSSPLPESLTVEALQQYLQKTASTTPGEPQKVLLPGHSLRRWVLARELHKSSDRSSGP